MVSMSEHSSLLGPAWYILQVLRACNVLALLSVAMSSMIMVVKTNIVTNFFVFQAVSHTITAGVATMLLISELPQPKFLAKFYRNNWPIFTTVDACNRGHSLAWLGVWMIAMGIWVMGSLNAADLIDDLSFPLWRLTLASGILAFVFGLFNLIVSLIFRNSAHGITVRMIREHGANVYNVRMIMAPYEIDASTLNSGIDRSNSVTKEKTQFASFHHPFPAAANPANRFSRLFAGRDKKPQISAPIITHRTASPEPDLEAGPYSRPETADRNSWEGPDRASPIVPGVQRPPTALHPAYTLGGRSSIYSEASHLNRF
ncbi:hypothetical protein BD289DRAFT_376984 [Coniella lustricola]|uniref:DUF7598 domain-containing protein n=1 Tax=Coniella lustricola TaxID=2025994 RepID=A0A2T2ZW25_9PEZI|nr:hypothetical protein BD289DRAFT_376984 [Coniella lustricola]